MPTVLRIHGMRVIIYTDDHSPAHVHAFEQGGVAVVVLNCPDGPPEVRERSRMPKRRADRIAGELAPWVRQLCREWETLHGEA
ncbi:DUF4160 domain-containing protein [Salinarimonas sp.]|uniref:DUF4160 domain-containing protein n=1 Tax=Salinarimonas sp. TaxID=2766526 RepID=UPI0032D8FFDF